MKKLILAAAVATAYSGAAFAATDLDTATGSGGTYASEATFGGPTQNLAAGAAADHTGTAAFGASFATGFVAYVRFDIAGGTFTAPVANTAYTVQDSAPAAATVSVAQGGTAGSNYVIFAVAPSAGTENLVAANIGTFVAGGITVADKGGVTLRYRLYETLTNAANQTLDLKDTGAGNWLSFANAITVTAGTAQTAIADVAATNGAYTAFLTAPTTEKAVAAVTVSHTARATLAGAATLAATVVADTNSMTINGDFVARATATTGVDLSTAADCSNTIGGTTLTVSDAAATLSGITAANLVSGAPIYVCYTVNGTTAIPEASYTGSVDVVGQTGYVPNDGSTGTGSITRNGTILKAAFAEGTSNGGFSTTVTLSNNGTIPAPFMTSCITTAGRVAGNGGSIPAGNGARFGVNSAGGLNCPDTTRGIELTFAVPTGTVIGSVVRQNVSTGVANFDGMVGNN